LKHKLAVEQIDLDSKSSSYVDILANKDTTKTCRHDIAEILLKVSLNIIKFKKSINLTLHMYIEMC
jgi:hypothetical protein